MLEAMKEFITGEDTHHPPTPTLRVNWLSPLPEMDNAWWIETAVSSQPRASWPVDVYEPSDSSILPAASDVKTSDKRDGGNT
jgi:hypothetical protein